MVDIAPEPHPHILVLKEIDADLFDPKRRKLQERARIPYEAPTSATKLEKRLGVCIRFTQSDFG